MPNQTDPHTGLPKFGPEYGDKVSSAFDTGTLRGYAQADLRHSDDTQYHNNDLSWLAGQRFSRCTCPDETDHPGPKHPDGTWKGRGATEIDIFEATVIASEGIGEVSMSGQWVRFCMISPLRGRFHKADASLMAVVLQAPFNPGYEYLNSSDEYFSMYSDACSANTYLGGA